jgi:hypothetical protein
MVEGPTALRARALVASWFAVLVAVAVALAVVGGAAAYTAHVDPGTTTEQVDRTHWSTSGRFAHSADVTRENPVFDVGSTLSNRSTYYTGVTPVLDGRYVLRYAGAGAEPATVDLDAALVIQSATEETVYWSNRTPLDSAEARSVAPGESVEASFSLNATAVSDRRLAIQTALGDTGGELSTFVAVDVTVAGTANGEPANLSFTHRLPIAVGGDTYSVGPEETASESVTTTRTVTTTREYGPFWSLGGPILLLVGASAAAALVVGRRREAFALSTAERDLLAFRDERAEFDEWVVRARLSTDEFDGRARADAESLADVVDFAIDAGTGVVEDPGSGLFYAVAEELVVVYEPPTLARREVREADGHASDLIDDSDGVSLTDAENGSVPADDDEADDETEGEGTGDDEASGTDPSWDAGNSESPPPRSPED